RERAQMVREYNADHFSERSSQKITKVKWVLRSDFSSFCSLRFLLCNSAKIYNSWQRLCFDRKHGWKIAHNCVPGIAGVDRCINLTASCSEVNAARIE